MEESTEGGVRHLHSPRREQKNRRLRKNRRNYGKGRIIEGPIKKISWKKLKKKKSITKICVILHKICNV
jgi:hypothetical protein